MIPFTDEQRKKNMAIFKKKIEALGIDPTMLIEKYGDVIESATFSQLSGSGMAYDGSMLEIVLKTLTPYAIKINELLPEEKKVPKETIVKICLLHHISKAVRLVKNDNSWEVEKKGMIYKYLETLPAIRTGLHSLMMCQECGISFTLEECEAMTTIDRDLTDAQSRFYSSILSTLVRQANELTTLQFKQ